MKNKETILEIKNLSINSKNDKKTILNNISFSVLHEEIVAIVGQSGSGKSLLAHDILGLLPKNISSFGDIIYKNKKLFKDDKKKLRGDEISLIPQSISYLDPMCKVGVQACGKNGKIIMKKVIETFADLGLEKDILNLYPHELSGGMARKVLVAISLISDANLFIADEPTNGLDAEASLNILSMFDKLRISGKSFLLITHDIDLAIKIANKIVVFNNGKIVEIISKETFCDFEQMLNSNYSKNLFHAMPSNGFKMPKKECSC